MFPTHVGIYKSEKIQANLDLKDKGGNKDVYQFFGSNLWVQIFLNMKEHQKKSALKQKIEASLYTLDRGFKKISFTLYLHLCFSLQNGGTKFKYTKAGFKNYRNLSNFRQAVESPKS